MRPVRSILALAVVLVAVAACSSGDPNWTYAPPPSETPAASGSPSGGPVSAAPSAPASAAASEAPSAAPSAPVSAAPSGGAGELVQVSAVNVAFEQDTLTVPADVPLQIEFANHDAGIPHNVAIRDSGGTEVFTGDIFNGVETRTYDAPAAAAGEYQWVCTVHPNMIIEVTAE